MLKGIRVTSLEGYIAAPYCTSILAEAGAEVIKVERPGSGDPRRDYDPLLKENGHSLSGGFASYNRGKRSLAIDLHDPETLHKFKELLKTSDVLISNLRPGTLDSLGFDVATCARDFERLIVCEISGFGQTGPFAKWPAFDSVIQAMSGLSSLIGETPESAPGLAPMGTMDLLGGVYSTIGILMALVQRQRTGRGTRIDAAMYDIGAAFLERPLALYEFTGKTPTRGADNFSPVGSFICGDGGWVSIVIPTDAMWQRCLSAIDRYDLAVDERLQTVVKRAENMRTLIIPALEEWAADKTKFEAAKILREAGQPAGVVQTIAEVRECEHLRARELFQAIDDPLAAPGDLRLPHFPLIFNDVDFKDARTTHPGPIPELGEANEEFGF